MLIKHINNSFFQVSSDNLKIVCDPWIGRMEGTSTWSFPNICSNKGILNVYGVKLKYAHMGGVNPIIIVIYGTNVKNIPKTYFNCLEKCFLRKLNLKGNVVKLKFKSS